MREILFRATESDYSVRRYLFSEVNYEYEVVDNIHDNPELLEG